MDFEKFQKDFLSQLKSKNKKCLVMIEDNKELIKENLGDEANLKTLELFVDEINNIIVGNDNSLITIIIDGGDSSILPFQKKYTLFEKVLKHPLFSRVLEIFRYSDVLIKACKFGNKSAAKWLLTMDISPYVQDEEGKSALMYAILQDFDFVIKPYLSDSLCMNLVDKNEENILFYCLRHAKYYINDVEDNYDFQNDIIFYSNVNINQTNSKGESVLTYCIKNNLIEPINKFLLTHTNIDVNIADNEGKTAAIYLTEKGLYAELLQLCHKNCNYEYTDLNGQSALSILLNKLYNSAQPSLVPYERYVHIMSTFVNYQLDFNCPVDNDENTAFMVLLIVNDMSTLKFCAENISMLDLSVKNKYGENATSLCFKLKHFELLPYFRNNPTFNYAYRDPLNQNTLLMIAAVNYPFAMVELLENDPNIINEVNSKNENALIMACKVNQLKSVDILLKNGININHQDHLGNTALHYAIDIRAQYLIHKLMEKQPDIHIKNNEGKSAFDLALEIPEEKLRNEIFNIIIDPFHSLKEVRIHSDIDKKYFEEIENSVIPYANNDYSDYVSTAEMEEIKKEIYNKSSKSSSIWRRFLSKELFVILLVILFVIVCNVIMKFNPSS